MSRLVSLVHEHLREPNSIELRGTADNSDIQAETFLNQNVNLVTRNWGYAAYPEYQNPELLSALSSIYNVPEENLMITQGGEGAINRLSEMFCSKDDAVLTHGPTFFSYQDFAQKQGAHTLDVPLIKTGDTYKLDTKGIVNAASDKNYNVKMLWICNPNNPTGTYFEPHQVFDILERLKNKDVAVIIDEAYIEISGKKSMTEHIDKYPNMIVMRTLSKAYSAAGLRVGAIISGDTDFLDIARKTPPFYSASEPSVTAALELLDPSKQEEVQESYKKIRALRRALSRSISNELNIKVDQSDTNFLLLHVDEPEQVYTSLIKQHKIKVGDPNLLSIGKSVRVSIGESLATNLKLLESLQDLREQTSLELPKFDHTN